jgi:flagellar motor switch protein FliM
MLQTVENFEVEMGEVKLSIDELLNLEIGDTLILNQIEKPMICRFGGKAKFIGKIGASKDGKAAVKITGMFKEVEGKEEKIKKVKDELTAVIDE